MQVTTKPTFKQIYAEAWEELEAKKAKERKQSNLKQGDEKPERPNLDARDQGRTDEKVAQKVGSKKRGSADFRSQ